LTGSVPNKVLFLAYVKNISPHILGWLRYCF